MTTHEYILQFGVSTTMKLYIECSTDNFYDGFRILEDTIYKRHLVMIELSKGTCNIESSLVLV